MLSEIQEGALETWGGASVTEMVFKPGTPGKAPKRAGASHYCLILQYLKLPWLLRPWLRAGSGTGDKVSYAIPVVANCVPGNKKSCHLAACNLSPDGVGRSRNTWIGPGNF